MNNLSKTIILLAIIGIIAVFALKIILVTKGISGGKSMYEVEIGTGEHTSSYLTDTVKYTDHNTIYFKDMMGFPHEVSVLNSHVIKY